MTTGERIRDRRKELGLSAEYIAEKLNLSPATIYRYEKGDIEKISGDKLLPIAQILRTTPAYLMGWNVEADDIWKYDNIIPMPATKKIPLLGKIACGKPILAVENKEDYIDAPEFVFADFALRCKGDSMINVRIFDGDIVFVQSQPEVNDGEIAVVLIEDEATLKRVYIRPNKLILSPCNPMYDDMIYSGSELENVKILGKAVGFYSYL